MYWKFSFFWFINNKNPTISIILFASLPLKWNNPGQIDDLKYNSMRNEVKRDLNHNNKKTKTMLKSWS
ncbi:hypothetical protein VspSTUT11_33820 [Vibrio sp. STUT-A11]|nr:hypothetical protein VspSTUT11_33820 [Vibrio sp. STUT-A11]